VRMVTHRIMQDPDHPDRSGIHRRDKQDGYLRRGDDIGNCSDQRVQLWNRHIRLDRERVHIANSKAFRGSGCSIRCHCPSWQPTVTLGPILALERRIDAVATDSAGRMQLSPGAAQAHELVRQRGTSGSSLTCLLRRPCLPTISLCNPHGPSRAPTAPFGHDHNRHGGLQQNVGAQPPRVLRNFGSSALAFVEAEHLQSRLIQDLLVEVRRATRDAFSGPLHSPTHAPCVLPSGPLRPHSAVLVRRPSDTAP
jgi:hypothetical protein